MPDKDGNQKRVVPDVSVPARPLSIDPEIYFLYEGVTEHPWHEVPRLLYDTEFIYVSAGTYQLSVDGRVFRLWKNDIALVPPGALHESWTALGQKTKRHCFHFIWDSHSRNAVYPKYAFQASQFDPKLISPIPALIRHRFPVIIHADPALAGLVRQMLALMRERNPLGSLLLWPVLQSIFAEIPEKRSSIVSYPVAVAELKSLIDTQFYRPLGVADFSRVTRLSRSRIHTLFTTYLGLSPAAYLKLVRIETAKRHLQQGTMTVKEVALASGFQDSNYFCRLFRQEAGISPGDFRRSKSK